MRWRPRRIAMLGAGVAWGLAACRLFVDLDDLSGGSGGTPELDATPDTLANDAGDASDAAREASLVDAPDDSGPCPKGRGPDMVLVSAGGSKFCIDSTGVSQGQYLAFLQDKAGDLSGQDPACQWNTTYAPSQSCTTIPSFDPDKRKNKPVSGVDWCDAVAFCRWAGKRLCGQVKDGGPIDLSGGDGPLANAQGSEWFAACSGNGVKPFPYGFTFDGNACNGGDRDAGRDLTDVGSLAGCVGGVPGLFDMSGNLLEWEDACDTNGAVSEENTCSYRGGTYYSPEVEMRCDALHRVRRAHVDGDCDLGIRCCATPK